MKKRKLRRKIAKKLVEKFPYWNTCPNEREMILDIVLSKKERASWESHCKMDCSIDWCECHPKYGEKESSRTKETEQTEETAACQLELRGKTWVRKQGEDGNKDEEENSC